MVRVKIEQFFLTLFLFSNLIHYNNGDGLCDFFENLAFNISEPCLKQLHVVCNNSTLAWKMFDASSKFLTSGMTYSNVIDYGNFPECLSINYNNSEIIGKYCGLSVLFFNFFLTPQTEKNLQNFGVDTSKPRMVSSNQKLYQFDMDVPLKDLNRVSTELKAQLRDTLIDSVPFVVSKYSVCVPDACTPQEVGNFYLYGHLPEFNVTLLMYTNLPCETVNSNSEYEAGDIVVIIVFALVGLLMVVSTVYDAMCQNFRQEPHHPILLSFSVLYNGKKLLQISNNTTEQIQCFNGMRFISMMWVVAFHAVSPFEGGVIGLENFPKVKEWDKRWTSRYIQSGLLAVDTFFFISGFLLAFSYLKKATEEKALQQILKVPKMYLHRYLRLTPSVAAMYLVTITIFRFLGSGPTWTLITSFMKKTCEDKWWKFFLYIQNYTDPDEMCVMPMWYLSADMQMFILAPLVLIPVALFIKKRFKNVIHGLVLLTIISIVVPMLTRYFVDEAAGNTSTSHERFNNFLIGITFGATMRMKKQKPYIFGPWANFGLWVLVLVVSLAFNIYWHDVLDNYDLLKYTLFMGIYRPVWCLCLVFMVYSCYHNQGGIIQWLLERPAFQILGRLSYSMYVMHVLVELYAAGTLNTNTYFSNYALFYHWCGHIIVTMIMALIWVFAFEFPMLTIDRYILGEGTQNKKEKK